MRRQKKIVLCSIVAMGLIISLLFTTIFQAGNVVYAEAMMPGIEAILNNHSQSTPFQILEIVEEKGQEELGYYVEGQEPYIKNYVYQGKTFSSMEEGLTVIEKAEDRKDFAEANSDSNKLAGLVGEGKETFPLTLQEYKETYFLQQSEQESDWNRIDLEKNRVVAVNGSYVENKDYTGNYTKKEQSYYPIRENVTADKDKEGLYKENIKNFSYTEGLGAVSGYNLTFEGVTAITSQEEFEASHDELINQYQSGYGYYINDYRILTESIDTTTFPGEGVGTVASDDGFFVYRGVQITQYPYYYYEVVQGMETFDKVKAKVVDTPSNEGDVTITNDVYFYWTKDKEGKLQKEELFYVQGKEPVDYEQVQVLSDELPEDYTYYYKVKEVSFACRLPDKSNEADPNSYEFYGWYFPNYVDIGHIYVPVDTKEEATHYISQEEYSLTKGTGNYDFVPDSSKPLSDVEIDHFYYQGGMKNNEWLKRFVFHLNEDGEHTLDSISIVVDVKTTSEVEQLLNANPQYFSNYSLIYTHANSSETILEPLKEGAGNRTFACIFRTDVLNDSGKNTLKNVFSYFWQENDADGCYVTENVYMFQAKANKGYGIFTKEFYQAIFNSQNDSEKKQSGFLEMLTYIEEENKYRKVAGEELLSNVVSISSVIEYILNVPYKRVKVEKDTIRILELQPLKSSGQIDANTVYKWLGLTNSTDKKPQIIIDRMTTSEYVGHIEDLNTVYDIVYFGDDQSMANTNKDIAYLSSADYTNILYSHVGRTYEFNASSGYYKKYLGILDIEYTNNKTGLGNKLYWTGSGNDITAQHVKALKDFCDSGYPVILANSMVTANNQIAKVDTSSYIYEFLAYAITKDNVMPVRNVNPTTISFYAQLAKPKIVFEENGTPPNAIGTSSGPSGNYLQGNQLEYVFHIENDSAISQATTTYNCELFVDLNADGVFSTGVNSSENLRDIKIYDEIGHQVFPDSSGIYHLKGNTVYRVTREIPQNYYKLIQWKLQVSSNQTEQRNVRTSEIGYTKKQTPVGDKPTIKVLQIRSVSATTTWNLSTDASFKNLMKQVEDFNIQVETITVTQYLENYVNYYNNKDVYGLTWLSQYDMVIIGFADMQDDIPTKKNGKVCTVIDEDGVERNPVEGLVKYIENGNSVLFSHDNTSFVNQQIGGFKNDKEKLWGYNLNTILRPLVGMDRYGVTLNKEVEGGVTVSELLKKGMDLPYTNGSESIQIDDIKDSVGDMAYKLNSNRTQTIKSVHGFSNFALDGWSDRVGKTTQVNQGAITEYPYKIDKNLNVSTTHSQYYQLALEVDDDKDGMNDIVVWYCLAGGKHYDWSPNDVRNAYYLYSKGNVLYTGVGHSKVNSEMERKLFINTIVAAWRAGKSVPAVSFVEEFNIDANEQTIKYYGVDQMEVVEDNIVNKDLQLYLTIDDIKLIPGTTENTSSDLALELFIESENGTIIDGITDTKVEPLTLKALKNKTNTGTEDCVQRQDGSWVVRSGMVYEVTIEDITAYVTEGSGYSTPKIFARVTSKYQYYGKQETSVGVTNLRLQQIQLFDLD